MNVALHRPPTVAEFLVWEERQELRHEFDGLRPEAMTGSTVAPDPVVIFEVLSRGTAAKDRGIKNRECAATPSIRRYVMLEQVEIAATMFERVGDDWVGHILAADAVIRMPEIGIELPLAELYEGLDLATPEEDAS